MKLKDLANLCNVSVSTVSKAFCDADDIGDETKEMIFEMAKKNGCYEKYYKGRYHKFVVAVICPEVNSDLLMELPQSFINVKMTEPDEPQRSYVYVFAEANVNILEPNGIMYGAYS